MRRSEEENVLRWVLRRAQRARQRKMRLDGRLVELRMEMEMPIRGVTYDGMPKGSGNGEGSAALALRLSEIEDKICEQKAEVMAGIAQAMNILAHLPQNDVGREICEMLYIDGMQWGRIAANVPMSRSQCYVRHDAAIRQLLSVPRVREIVEESREAYRLWKSRL